ncbi:uncharacterized protein [Nicotiana tomentosiformis]|uniref:uncharacterized protein n=1 Tax=Nicotiana tomentosiformis TaxID=4098 RepID=UPI00388C9B88
MLSRTCDPIQEKNHNVQKVDAEDDVWEQYLAAHPNDGQYRTKKLPDYNTLALIFGDSTVADALRILKQLNQLVKIREQEKERLAEEQTLASRPKRIRNSIGISLVKSVDRWTAIAEEQIRLQHEPRNTSAEKLMHLIMELELDDAWNIRVIDLLTNERNAEFFAAMAPPLRKKWVMHKLGLYD